ncbi:hypothetical protein [Ruegeria arenilitoris]|uniref:hypothetical protein n=1 Tax=Ruegeria arenilitoris TaxID=1173585 RepID=UPI00147988A8|nr:hypothetical protein [Ruegeria arenilitoris]
MSGHRYKRALRGLADRFGCTLVNGTKGWRFERGDRAVVASRAPRRPEQHLAALEQTLKEKSA